MATDTVAEIMTRDLRQVALDRPVREAAQLMRENDIGDVLVVDGDRTVAIVTDRDITVRLVAEERSADTPVREICSSTGLVTVSPETTAAEAVRLMREHAVRRLPVIEDGRAVGIVSLGDMALALDETSALADVSAAEGNV